MLIAIMSSTFDRQASNLGQLGKTQKLNMMAEYLKIVNLYRDRLFSRCRLKSEENQRKYLFVVFPQETEEDDTEQLDETTQHLRTLKRTMQASFKGLENMMNRQLVRDLQSLSNETKARLNAMERDYR